MLSLSVLGLQRVKGVEEGVRDGSPAIIGGADAGASGGVIVGGGRRGEWVLEDDAAAAIAAAAAAMAGVSWSGWCW